MIHPALLPVTRPVGRTSKELSRIPERIATMRKITFVSVNREKGDDAATSLMEFASQLYADIQRGKYPGYKLGSLDVSKTSMTGILIDSNLGEWPTANKIFDVIARQGTAPGKDMIVEVRGVVELKDQVFDLDVIPHGQWWLPDGAILAMSKKLFAEYCVESGLDPAYGQAQGTIWSGNTEADGIVGKGLIVPHPYEDNVVLTNLISVGETRVLNLRDVWSTQRRIGRMGRARPSFFGALSMLAPIDSRYRELIKFLVESVSKRADSLEELFAVDLDDDEENEASRNTDVGIAAFCMMHNIPVPMSMLEKVRGRSERILLSAIASGGRFPKNAAGAGFGSPYIPRGIVFQSGANMVKSFTVRHPFMGIGSVIPMVLIGRPEHVDDALDVIHFTGNRDHVKWYVKRWMGSKLIHLSNLDLLALLGDSDGDPIHVFGEWTGEYRPLKHVDFVVEETKLRQKKGMGLQDMEPQERLKRMVYRTTKGQIGLYDGPAMNIGYASLSMVEKGIISVDQHCKNISNAMLVKHLFGVVSVKHQILHRETREPISPEVGLSMLRNMAAETMEKAGFRPFWLDSLGRKHPADTPRHRFLRALKIMGKAKGIQTFDEVWKLRLDETGLGRFYADIIERVHHTRVSIVSDADFAKAMMAFAIRNMDEFDMFPESDRSLHDRVKLLLNAYHTMHLRGSDGKTGVENAWNDLMVRIADPRISFWAAVEDYKLTGKIPYGLLLCPLQIGGCAHKFARELRVSLRSSVIREEYLYFPSEK